MTTADTQVTVTQADREAAAALLWSGVTDSIPAVAEWHRIRSGNYDDHRVVRAFARHRLAAEKQAREAERAALRSITMQDVRLAAGEGKLTPADVLAGCNAELRRRAALVGWDMSAQEVE